MRTSMRFSTRFLSNLAFVSMLIAGCARAEDVVEETTVDDAGIVETCGEGGGLDPCRDADGETYQHADDPNYIKLDYATAREVIAADPQRIAEATRQDD